MGKEGLEEKEERWQLKGRQDDEGRIPRLVQIKEQVRLSNCRTLMLVV